MKHIFLFAICTLFLTSCVTREERIKQEAEMQAAVKELHATECTELGFYKGSEKYAQCMLDLKLDFAETRRSHSRNNAIWRSNLNSGYGGYNGYRSGYGGNGYRHGRCYETFLGDVRCF